MSSDTKKRIVADEFDKFTRFDSDRSDHKCVIFAPDLTAFWWCGEDKCQIDNAIMRESAVKTSVVDGECFIEVDLENAYASEDLEHILWGHSCAVNIGGDDGYSKKYRWCGRTECSASSVSI